ncbi:adaptor protein MecA [Lacicoccus alkaliphilus]|uniref:Adapter protein MecA n=1 Tax=Lacicoccus alkaliphilus DSM 16010 TaxID=1123231 RepID=A0A1M7G6I9_9BACL|nr:adaptor protein MecA [Salinicoccus alkaliphilus]SHM11880.1 adapter protein MecA 1/2 [Salinicoccus alkaliphilus DSM 16010]
MRIERVNESTIKFFMTYADIEKRGFDRDELWMNRKRGEEFFWSLMDEVNVEHGEGFGMEGPLWIQVHAYDRGIEVVVSKSQNGEEDYAMDPSNMNINDNDIESFLNDAVESASETEQSTEQFALVKFDDFETLIEYAHQVELDETVYEDLLHVYNGEYYYQVIFDHRLSKAEIQGVEASLTEYGSPSDVAPALIEEYGDIIMSHNVRAQVRRFFQEK